MPALSNPKHEHFARLLASDIAAPVAYQRAGFRPDPSNAAKLAKRPAIAERASELRKEALKAEGVSVDKIVAAAAAIAFSDPRSFFTWDEHGVRVLPSSGLTSEQACVVSQVEQLVTPRGEKSIRVKLADRTRALEMLARWHGLDKPSQPDPDAHWHLHVESPAQIIADRLALLAKRNAVVDYIPPAYRPMIEAKPESDA